MEQKKFKKGSQLNKKGIMVVVALIGLLVTWYLDENLHSQIRFMPLCFGLFVCLRGIDWLQEKWKSFGLFHILLGLIPIGMGVAPLVLGFSSKNQYFGLEGIYELSAMGIIIIAISMMEHLIFLNVRVSDFDKAGSYSCQIPRPPVTPAVGGLRANKSSKRVKIRHDR